MKKIISPVGSQSDGGFPFYLDDLIDLQETQARYGISHFKSIILNNNGIITEGLSVTGVGPYNISQGYVYLDGDLRFFPSTSIATLTGYIVADTDLVESRVFFDGNNNPVKVTKRAKWQAGSPAMGFDGISIFYLTNISGAGADFFLSNFTRGVPTGGIIMWDNNGYIPLGFALCDGSFGTPNLTGKFVRANNTAGGTGGSGSFTIATGNLPSHSHTISGSGTHNHTTSTAGLHRHEILIETGGGLNVPNALTVSPGPGGLGDEGYAIYAPPATADPYLLEDGNHTHTISNDGAHDHGGATGNTGSGTAINFVPTYHDLIFIKRIA